MQPIRLHVVADDPLVRATLAMLLTSRDDCLVVAQSDSRDVLAEFDDPDPAGETAAAIIWDLGWDVDAPLPTWDGVETPIVALLAEETAVDTVWRSGVTALLGRDADPDRLLAAAQAAALGLTVFDTALGPLPPATGPLSDDTPVDDLTPREAEVLHLLAEGLTNKAIAQQLEISSHTVKFHVNAIMTKLTAQSRTEAVVRATRLGLLSL